MYYLAKGLDALPEGAVDDEPGQEETASQFNPKQCRSDTSLQW